MKSSKKPYQCETCNKRYTTLNTLHAHEKLHRETRVRNFSCTICNKSFYTDQLREQHEKIHNAKKEYQCDICSSSFRTLNYLKNHVNAVHSGQKSFKCDVCDKLFARKAELENHYRTHTGERPFECKECGKTFNQRSNLQTHVRTTHKGEKRHQCPECHMSFKRRRLVTYHIYAKHRDEKPLKCPFCNKTFVYPQLFKKHQMSCKSKPQDEYFVWSNTEDETYLINRVGSDFYIVDPDEFFNTLNANFEEENSATIQSDYQEESMVTFQPSNNIQEIIDTSYPPEYAPLFQEFPSNDSFVWHKPNTHANDTIAMQHQNPDEMLDLLMKKEDGNWYHIDSVKENSYDFNEIFNINTSDPSGDSISLQELLQTAPRKNDIMDNLTENDINLFTDGVNFGFQSPNSTEKLIYQ